jgi:hypothetical protein
MVSPRWDGNKFADGDPPESAKHGSLDSTSKARLRGVQPAGFEFARSEHRQAEVRATNSGCGIVTLLQLRSD